jgi:murein L,D-transpeptidase YcbB/YkuD
VRLVAIIVSLLLSSPAMAQGIRSAPWTDAEVAALSDALAEAWSHGLEPADYINPAALRALEPGRERDRAARTAWFAYAEDLAFGRVDPRSLNEDWTATVRDQDLMTAYARARESGTIYESFEALAPAHPDYAALRAELVRRVMLPSTHAPIAAGETLAVGDSGPRVDALRARLFELGLLVDAGESGDPFDRRLESALMRFQAHHNLDADGRAGPSTILELNAGEDRRIGQLRANLERWRWLAADLGARHIRVNIADYRLEAWRDGRIERVHDAQIGTLYASTPVFSEEMSIIEINPWWLTPGSLGSRWVEAFRRNPAYAYSEGFHLVDLDTGRTVDAYSVDWEGRRFRVMQEPGPTNAMGQVKFLFPNVHNVYIHDTPHRGNFANARRDDSSGCVRVRDPQALAFWALSAEGWSPERVRDAFEGERTVRVRLQNTIPVHILYFTAVTDRRGEIRFVHDVYDRDAALIAALDGASITPQRRAMQEPDLNAAP